MTAGEEGELHQSGGESQRKETRELAAERHHHWSAVLVQVFCLSAAAPVEDTKGHEGRRKQREKCRSYAAERMVRESAPAERSSARGESALPANILRYFQRMPVVGLRFTGCSMWTRCIV